MKLSLKSTVILASALVLSGTLSPVLGQSDSSSNEPQPNTPIKHFIMLLQENHSFDNYFGTYPGANGIPEDVCMPVDPNDPTSDCIKPYHIGDIADVKMDDPDHSADTHATQYNNGLMNGFVYALDVHSQDGRLAMGYYDGTDLPYYWNIADEYVLFDNFFSSAHGGSLENHVFWVAGRTAPATGGSGNLPEALAGVPTIFDRLQEKGISWKFYVQNYDSALNYRTEYQYPMNRASQVIWVPLLTIDRFIDDPSLSSHIVDLNEYYDDLANGTLPSVAFMVPSGPSEHPPSSVLSGQRFLRGLLQRLIQSPYWDSTAFLWAYDDWGGWYDHVPPPQVDADGYGFRVPALLVSSYARRGLIDNTQLDFTSALKFIEDNWNLEPLAERDSKANSIIGAFDFSSPPRPAAFVPFERDTGEAKAPPRRDIIYITYGSAMIVTLGLAVAAYFWTKRRRTRLPDRNIAGEQGQ